MRESARAFRASASQPSRERERRLAELEKFVDGKVESGLDNNASEVVREGLRLLKENDEFRARVRESVERGWASISGACARRGTTTQHTRLASHVRTRRTTQLLDTRRIGLTTSPDFESASAVSISPSS